MFSYKSELESLKEFSLLRQIPDIEKEGKYVIKGGKKLLNLSSNDYLGIGSSKDIANSFLKNYKGTFGSGSARLLSGTEKIYKKLEALLAKLYNKESALIFNSGYHANVAITSTLLNKGSIVFSDKLNHASLLDGIKLSGCELQRFKHLDYTDLENKLKKHRKDHSRAFIISESLFSMDGDIANIKKLIELKKKYNCFLIIDEAHAFGAWGQNLLGVAQEQDIIDGIDLIVATFGKAIGSVGAFCVSNSIFIDYLINKARPFIFSTALPQINIEFSHFILSNFLPQNRHLIENLQKITSLTHNLLQSKSIQTIGKSHIIPIIVGTNENCIKKANLLQDSGFYLLPIRHPTVPLNTARIRISLRADIEFEEIKDLFKILK